MIKEHSIQVRLIQYIRVFHPDILIFSIPNGANTTALNRVNLVKEGLLSGVPDLFIAHINHDYAGLFIEMKREKGVVSPTQKKVMTQLEANGYCCVVCKSFDEGKKAIMEYLQRNAE
jgi:hypothetical protein